VQHKRPSDPTLSQKRAEFPAFSSRKATLGQIRKIGIHLINYQYNALLAVPVLPTGIYIYTYITFLKIWYIFRVRGRQNFDFVYMKNLVSIWYIFLEGLVKTLNQISSYIAKRKQKMHGGIEAI